MSEVPEVPAVEVPGLLETSNIEDDGSSLLRMPENAVNEVVNTDAESRSQLRYDYCIVMRTSEHKSISKLTSRLLVDWSEAGLDHYVYIPGDRSLVYILLRPKSIDILRNFAEKISYQMKLNADALEAELLVKKVEINGDHVYCKYSPYDFIYTAYRREIEQLFVMVPEHNQDMDNTESHPFCHSNRIKLIEMMLLEGSGRSQTTYEFNIKRLYRMGHIYSYFPMPDHWMKKELQFSCSDIICYKPIPDAQISEYFGSKMNIYFQV